jgi:hypothetical protein
MVLAMSRLVNPDPVGSETFDRIWIRIRKIRFGSEFGQLRIRNE